MKQIRIKSWTGAMELHTVQSYVSRSAAYVDPYGGGGISENSRQVATQTADALGRLVQCLADKGIVNAAEVQMIAEGYVPNPDAQLE